MPYCLPFSKHLGDLSVNYDFWSVRVGIQGFQSDFRGFLFSDNNMGIRLFGPVMYLGLLAFVRPSEWLGLARHLGVRPTGALAPDSEGRPG